MNPSSYTIVDSRQYVLSTSGSNVECLNGTKKSRFIYRNLNISRQNASTILHQSIKLLHAEMPYSFYPVDSGNNLLVINATSIAVPEGFYTAETLRNYINAQFPAATITLDTSTGKYTMTSASPYTIQATSTLLPVLGLTLGASYSGVWDGSSSYAISFERAVNTIKTRNLYIRTPNIVMANVNTRTGDTTTLRCIQVNVPPWYMVLYNDTTGTETVIGNSQLTELQLEIVDDNGEAIDFQDQNWTITVEVKSVVVMTRYVGGADSFMSSAPPPPPSSPTPSPAEL